MSIKPNSVPVTSKVPSVSASPFEIMTYRDALSRTMTQALEKHPHVIILGQGVDDHKGTFGTTLGLAERFGKDRVMDMPLAEEGMTGIAIGAALNGLYPIVTHIRADFSILATNQIVNLAAKYKYMSGGKFEVPLFIRMVIGRSWGQGAQHSQSLQALFAHIPGLKVIMPASAQSILETYSQIIGTCRSPVISLEHRLMYDLQFRVQNSTSGAFSSRKIRSGSTVTLAATSIMVVEAMRAADYLDIYGIDCEVIDLHSLSPLDPTLLLESVKKTGKLLVADTGWRPFGVSAEVCRIVSEEAPSILRRPVVTLGMEAAPCPTAKSLEDLYYPNLRILVDRIGKLAAGKENHGIPLPDENSMADVYKRFKGPF